ncbi:MAG: methionyl-tRNA formyltransferase [Candidatus Paceibacterota bacterium]|jgi:methionyl-tRNA formyltransferase
MSSKNLKFIFFGTPDVASKTLQILKERGYVPEVIVTSPDAKRGRGLDMHETPVAIWAKENNIKCLKPEKIDEEFIYNLEPITYNLFIVVAYGKILPENLIKKPEFGTINVHYSLLPKYRGASPLEACLLNGDEVTGVSIQQMEYQLDSGQILREERIDIGINDTKEELRETLIKLGANVLCDILPQITNKEITPKAQDESLTTFCKKIKKEDGELNLEGSAKENWNKYRAYSGWPEVFFFAIKHNKKIRCKITKAKLENNQFIIEKVIPESKKEIDYESFLKQN